MQMAEACDLGEPVDRFKVNPLLQVMLLLPAVGFTVILGVSVLAYAVIGAVATVALIVYSILFAVNKAYWLFENGFIAVDAFGGLKHVVTWDEVTGVDGIRVEIQKLLTTRSRVDFIIRIAPSKSIVVNGWAMPRAAQFVAAVATKAPL